MNGIVIEEDEEVQKSYTETFDLTIDDLDMKTDILMPRLDITEYLKVYGDHFVSSSD